MLPHLITAWIKREETSEAAANSREGKVLASHLSLLMLFPSWIEGYVSSCSIFHISVFKIWKPEMTRKREKIIKMGEEEMENDKGVGMWYQNIRSKPNSTIF